MSNPIILLGSNRSNGKTREAIDNILEGNKGEIVDLNQLDISPYDYEHKNINDDYIPLMKRVVEHDIMVLATPIYWYSVSTIMKIFIDRVNDLITVEKDLGRKLRGKKLFVIASYNTSIPKSFEDPLEQTCNYLGIEYLGCSFICSDPDAALAKVNDEAIEKARKILF